VQGAGASCRLIAESKHLRMPRQRTALIGGPSSSRISTCGRLGWCAERRLITVAAGFDFPARYFLAGEALHTRAKSDEPLAMLRLS
jgi:hypothetical protein